jgi:hypothetical protein
VDEIPYPQILFLLLLLLLCRKKAILHPDIFSPLPPSAGVFKISPTTSHINLWTLIRRIKCRLMKKLIP